MGVHGLWKLIEPAGKPIPLESLENKVLAVDVSIWLYQLTKGFQTTGGGSVPNAHLLGLFNRICKLLYYRIKPVFVFDGGVPLLKKETIEARKRMKRKAQDTSEQLREKLLDNLLKQNAVNQLLGNADLPSASSQPMEDMFALPPLPEKEESDEYDSESDTEVATAKIESFCDSQCGKDLHSIDITSEQFKSLPPEIRHEILSELQETRKQNSWAKIHEMPEQSQDFSKFQMERLRKRRNVQISLDTAAKEMGGRSMTLGELENLFREDGIVTDSLPGQRIIGDNVTRFVYITGKSKEKEKLQPEIETGTQIEEKSVKKAKEFDESDFHTKIQVIEECIFINDSSSEDDIDIINETKNSDISQEDLLKIIKQEQIQKNDEERVDEIDSYSISKLNEPVAGIEIVEATQTPNTRKISGGFSTSVPLIEESQSNSESQEIVFSELSDSYSVELFVGSDSQNLVNSNNQAATISESRVNKCPSLKKEPEYVKTVPVSIHNELNVKNNFSDNKSVELFSESESDDDFVEVTDCSQPSSYFKVSEKTLEISINPDVKVEDDIFADIFDEAISENKDTGDERNVQSVEKKPQQAKELNKSKLDIHPIEKKSERTKELNEPNKLAEILTKVKKAEKEIAAAKPSECKQSPSKNQKSTEENNELGEIQKMLSTEQNELLAEHGKQERLGSTITQQMIIEAQELLQLFGLPYLVAPMEAEAQCAFLDQISLTEGTITDDSDIWLFGGQKVYKNFFDNRKYVLQFRAIDIEHFFKLSREQLIQMALLVGSDYTVGIEGVGPVTALEILAYFSDPSNKPQTESDKSDIGETLRRFRLWLKTNRNSSTPLSKKCRNVTLSEAFPNTSVIEAYLYPTVNESKEGFSWATPDLDKIRQYMRSKFGWKSSRIDEILLPVMKRLLNKNKQSTLDSYFKAKSFAPLDFGHVSKRVIQAINVMKNKTNEAVLPIPSTSKSPKKREIILKTPTKKEKITKTRKKKSPLSASTSIKSMSPHKTAYFSGALSLKEKDKLEAAKRKVEAIKIFQAKNKCKRKTKIQKTLPAKPDSSYLSESSGDEI